MTKRILKRICVCLFLAAGLVFASSHDASAGLFSKLAGVSVVDANSEMAIACDGFQKNLADYTGESNCWTCEIFILLFDAANAVAGQINSTLAKPTMSLVVVGGLLWLAFVTLAFFGNISDAPNTMEYLTKVGTIMFRVGIAGCFLAGGSSVAFNYIINPVLTSGAQLASQTLAGVNGVSVTMSGNTSGGTSGPMGAGVRSSLKQMIVQMSSSMAKAQAVSQGLRCGSMFWKKLQFGVLIPIGDMLVPNPLMWAVGAWLGCIFWVISIMFCMAMLDVIFRIGLLVGILPVFIAAWVFPMTVSFAKTAWDVFLNSVLVFFITAIIAAFVIILSEKAWETGVNGKFSSFMGMMQGNAYVDAWDALFEGGAGAGLTTIFLVTCVVMWAWSISPKADGTAEKILGASFSSSVAIKALHTMLDFIMNMIMMVFTIVTAGLAACTYVLKIFSYVAKAMETVKKVQEAMDKIEKMQKKVRKIQQKAQKIKKAAEMAKKAIPNA